MNDAREHRVTLRLTSEAQRRRWTAAAKRSRRTLADWIRMTCDDEASRHVTVRLTKTPRESETVKVVFPADGARKKSC